MPPSGLAKSMAAKYLEAASQRPNAAASTGRKEMIVLERGEDQDDGGRSKAVAENTPAQSSADATAGKDGRKTRYEEGARGGCDSHVLRRSVIDVKSAVFLT